jgi:two-component system LytT family response regulator
MAREDDHAPLTALIADDEALARRRIAELLRDHREVRVVAQCATGPATLSSVRESAPDLLFLDVQMPGLTGFEVLAELRAEERPLVIFSTAYDEYALAAFDVHAVDYLLKPFSDERFEESLERAKGALRSEGTMELRRRLHELLGGLDLLEELGNEAARPGGRTGSRRPHLERFAVRKDDRVAVIDAASVDWIEAEGDYVSLHVGAKDHLVRATMASLEERLDPDRFIRIHRSIIVQLDRIRHLRINERGDYLAVLEGGERLRVGARYREGLLERVGLR